MTAAEVVVAAELVLLLLEGVVGAIDAIGADDDDVVADAVIDVCLTVWGEYILLSFDDTGREWSPYSSTKTVAMGIQKEERVEKEERKKKKKRVEAPNL